MAKVTEKNRQDLKNAKRFFEGYTFEEIKASIESGCFKNAILLGEEPTEFLTLRFESLGITFQGSSSARILSRMAVYDENGIISGSWNIEEDEKKKTTLDSVREWLKADEENNVYNILLYIKYNFSKEWDDFIADELNDTVNSLTPSELPDSLYDEIIQDWKGENEERVVNEWLQNEGYREIAEKICFLINGREIAREIIDAL